MNNTLIPQRIYNKIVINSVCRLRNVHKNNKITTEMIINAIIYTLDFLEIDENYEIEDDLILIVEEKYNLIPDQEKESLRQANKMYNKIVSGSTGISIPVSCNSSNLEEDWQPTNYSKSYEKKKADWEDIQDRIDNIRNKYEQMVHNH